MKTKYLTPSLNWMKPGLKVELNFMEEFLVLALSYNKPAFVANNRTDFTQAINSHDYKKLLALAEKAVGSTFSGDNVTETINTTAFKDYYRTVHFNNL
jgi:signal recognition particle receptor subunit beta